MKCYLIDPHARTITESEIPDGDELDLRALIGDDCRRTYLWAGSMRPPLSRRDALYTADYTGDHDLPRTVRVDWIAVSGEPSCCLGRAVVLGHTADGEPCIPSTSLDVLRRVFTFGERPR